MRSMFLLGILHGRRDRFSLFGFLRVSSKYNIVVTRSQFLSVNATAAQSKLIVDLHCGMYRSAASNKDLDSRCTSGSELQHLYGSGHERRRQQQQQEQQRQEGFVGESKVSSGDRRSEAVQRLVDLQHQSKHLSRLLAVKKQAGLHLRCRVVFVVC